MKTNPQVHRIPHSILSLAPAILLTLSFLERGNAQPFTPTNITPDSIAGMGSLARSNLIFSFEKSKKQWASTNLLAIGIAYAMEGRFAESQTAFVAYLDARPDDARANRGLGGVYLAQEKIDQAIPHLVKAWEARDAEALPLLAGAYLSSKRVDKAKELVPAMLRVKEEAQGRLRMNLVKGLSAYAVSAKPFDTNTFLRTIRDVTDDEVLATEGAPLWVINGLKYAGDEKRAETLIKRWEAQRKANSRE